MANRILFGAIADDFTGATDLANILVRGGMRTVQTIGVPTADTELPECDAVVVALKSRTIPVGEAVAQSLAALEWLQAHGAQQFFLKVCSTFDSTDAGNIGQVADALLDALGEKIAVVCPAYPDNRRKMCIRDRPLVYALLATTVGFILVADLGHPLETIFLSYIGGVEPFILIAVPLFIFAGELLSEGGVGRRIVDFAHALLGFMPGGLGVVTVASCLMFGLSLIHI